MCLDVGVRLEELGRQQLLPPADWRDGGDRCGATNGVRSRAGVLCWSVRGPAEQCRELWRVRSELRVRFVRGGTVPVPAGSGDLQRILCRSPDRLCQLWRLRCCVPPRKHLRGRKLHVHRLPCRDHPVRSGVRRHDLELHSLRRLLQPVRSGACLCCGELPMCGAHCRLRRSLHRYHHQLPSLWSVQSALPEWHHLFRRFVCVPVGARGLQRILP